MAIILMENWRREITNQDLVTELVSRSRLKTHSGYVNVILNNVRVAGRVQIRKQNMERCVCAYPATLMSQYSRYKSINTL